MKQWMKTHPLPPLDNRRSHGQEHGSQKAHSEKLLNETREVLYTVDEWMDAGFNATKLCIYLQLNEVKLQPAQSLAKFLLFK